MVNILWKVILSECFCYIVLNVYLVSNWVIFLSSHSHLTSLQIKSGRLNTMVNKFTCLSRVYGILYVIGSGSEKTLDAFSNEVFLCFRKNPTFRLSNLKNQYQPLYEINFIMIQFIIFRPCLRCSVFFTIATRSIQCTSNGV